MTAGKSFVSRDPVREVLESAHSLTLHGRLQTLRSHFRSRASPDVHPFPVVGDRAKHNTVPPRYIRIPRLTQLCRKPDRQCSTMKPSGKLGSLIRFYNRFAGSASRFTSRHRYSLHEETRLPRPPIINRPGARKARRTEILLPLYTPFQQCAIFFSFAFSSSFLLLVISHSHIEVTT